jgi:hypothetical protein
LRNDPLGIVPRAGGDRKPQHGPQWRTRHAGRAVSAPGNRAVTDVYQQRPADLQRGVDSPGASAAASERLIDLTGLIDDHRCLRWYFDDGELISGLSALQPAFSSMNAPGKGSTRQRAQMLAAQAYASRAACRG